MTIVNLLETRIYLKKDHAKRNLQVKVFFAKRDLQLEQLATFFRIVSRVSSRYSIYYRLHTSDYRLLRISTAII